MACPAQSILSASSTCIFLRNKPQATARGGGISISSNGLFLLSCNASSSSPPSPAPSQDESEDCNEECAPEKEVGSLSAEWLAEERTKMVGTFPPKKKGWTGHVEDTAGQTNISSVEVAESAISSGGAGTSAEGSQNTAAFSAGLALICVAAASSILIQVNKNQPQVQALAKFQSGPSVEEAAPDAPSGSPTVEASASRVARRRAAVLMSCC